jgi:hypothetical protein
MGDQCRVGHRRGAAHEGADGAQRALDRQAAAQQRGRLPWGGVGARGAVGAGADGARDLVEREPVEDTGAPAGERWLQGGAGQATLLLKPREQLQRLQACQAGGGATAAWPA